MRLTAAIAFLIFATARPFADCAAQNLLRQPESVVFDAPRERYLVSNKQTGEIVAIDALMAQSYFKTGLGSCRGLAIVGDTVYAATSIGVVGADLSDGSTAMIVPIPGMQFLNDIAADSSGCLYVSDMNAGIIYRMRIADRAVSIAAAGGVGSCNGLLYDHPRGRLLVCLWPYPGYIKAVDLSTLEMTQVAVTDLGDCDGLAVDNAGNIYISSWASNAVYRYDKDFSLEKELVSGGHSGPADIYFNIRDRVLAVPNFNANTVDFVSIAVSGVDEVGGPRVGIRFLGNYPNPFNPSTTVEFDLSESSFVELTVYDILGRKVRTILRETMPAGRRSVAWDGKGDSGRRLASGTYFCRVFAGGSHLSKKMVLLK